MKGTNTVIAVASTCFFDNFQEDNNVKVFSTMGN